MLTARFLVVMIALEAPQFSRGQLIGPGCCRTMGGGLRAWDEPSTAEAIAAKRVHDRPMNRTACAVECAALERCTHFELNMHDQPAHSKQGACSVFASGGYSVTTACRDSSARPRIHCFEAANLRRVQGGHRRDNNAPLLGRRFGEIVLRLALVFALVLVAGAGARHLLGLQHARTGDRQLRLEAQRHQESARLGQV